ncbi:hypothetical protein [Vibrio sp. SCSIO 43137]|uniref:hypothetical protein n=1 Tax=Vibrio sp. SCSIO 43137 TaxID=3021011 RepID=UPI002307F2EF|nr:hypothetical protein [Vibrio sp. SCSIO 43137]WCE30102.1 hypothetical protein PK654_02050 [Vibrio sp. SCSIO 43137]
MRKGKEIQVTCKPSNHTYTLRERDQITVPVGVVIEEVHVLNLGEAGEIELGCIEGKFQPSIDGSKLNIAADLEADNLAVTFEGRQPVELPANQQVKAELTNLPETLSVHVENQLQVPDVQKVHVVKETQPNTQFIAHETMTKTGRISGNVNRQMVILKAADSNQETIWLGGYQGRGFPLPPASCVMWGVTAEIEALILGANDELLVSEVV